MTVIQYVFFGGEEVPIALPSHGNSKKNKRPYFRTQKSTLDDVKENIDTMRPKHIVEKLYNEAGGILHVQSSGEVCRNRTQVYNAKRYQQRTSGLTSNCKKDLVYDLLEQNYSSESDFVRSVCFDGDSVMSVVGLQQQFDDIERFCASDQRGSNSVLGIDPTFQLGDFFVTPTTYEHKLLINRKTGKHPVLLGPLLIHQNRKYGTYHYFASQLLKMKPGLKSLRSFGTDGEEALFKAFHSVFPSAVHVLCEIHKRDNITTKLRSMKACSSTIKQILGDIFGSTNGDVQFGGLVDSSDATEFDTNLKQFQTKWNESCMGFFEWFVKNESGLFTSCMINSVRSVAGLGHPPKHFTTNNNKSINHLLKLETNGKRSEWPAFNCKIRGICEEQQNECDKAVFDSGDYEVGFDHKDMVVPQSQWILMTPEQRKERLRKFQKTSVSHGAISVTPSESSPSSSNLASLSITWENSGIQHVHSSRLEDMWQKASTLLSTPGFIVPSAGNNSMARQVASLSNQQMKHTPPHFVYCEDRKTGKEVRCDCPVFKSTPNICQHALAAAEDMSSLFEYLEWVRKTKKSCNLSQLISHAVPKNAGEKNSRRKGGRSKKELPLVPLSSFTNVQQQQILSEEHGANESTSYYYPSQPPAVSYSTSHIYNTNSSVAFNQSPSGRGQPPIVSYDTSNVYNSNSSIAFNQSPGPSAYTYHSPYGTTRELAFDSHVFWILSIVGTQIVYVTAVKTHS